jgi:hypothetical protein
MKREYIANPDLSLLLLNGWLKEFDIGVSRLLPEETRRHTSKCSSISFSIKQVYLRYPN